MTHIVICGAGIAGISAAYFLAVHHGVRSILLVDERPPLSLTSDKSTEAYRNFWPGPDNVMIALMNRSIDLLETLARSHHNSFRMNRRGYLYATAQEDAGEQLQQAAERAAQLGGGPLRYHTTPHRYVPSPPEGFHDVPDGIDIVQGAEAIRALFPYLNPATRQVVHIRRAGWLSAHELGMLLLERARAHGVRWLQGRVIGVERKGGRISQVWIRQDHRERAFPADVFVNAAGPFLPDVARLLDVDLPVFCEAHAKWMFNDYQRVLPRDAPLIIWAEPQQLPWSPEERQALEVEPDLRYLLGSLPPGVHVRPEGGEESSMLLLLWGYASHPSSPHSSFSVDPLFPEIVLRGITTAVPGFRRYWDRMPKPVIDGGYYTKTPENLPLIGPLPVEGAYVIGALSGFGIMAACAAGELLSLHILNAPLPPYAPAFHPARYTDPNLYPNLSRWSDSWQL